MAIAERIRNDAAIAEEKIPVAVEEELSASSGRQVIVYLIGREAPRERQSISAGTRTRFLVRFSIMCYAFALQFPRAMELRDDLLGRVEVALMKEPRTFGRAEVFSSWLDGGEFENARGEAGTVSFMSCAEVSLVVEVESTIA